jgi:MoaA/NifB/PqqE/SkfB family radical SAM enzyme
MKKYTKEQLKNYEIERETIGLPNRLMIFTSGCNNNCVYCFTKKNYPFNKEIAFNLIDKYYTAGVLNLAGGEPTICPFIEEIIRYAKSKQMKVNLMTNGRKLSDCQFLKNLMDAGIDKVIIPFHSHLKEVHNEITRTDSFDESTIGIQNCILRGVKTQLMLIVHKKNYQNIDKTIKIMCSMNPDSISIESLVIAGRSIDNFDELVIKLSKIAPFLEKGLDVLIEKGIPFSINSFPLCLFKEKYWPYFGCSINQVTATNFEFKEKSELVTSGLSLSEKCLNCSLKDVCPGTWIPYYSIFGDDELRPVKG